METKLNNILQAANSDIAACKTLHDLANQKSRFIGKKSELNSFMKELGKLPKEERPAFGQKINIVKEKISELIETQTIVIKELSYQSDIATGELDISMPGRRTPHGALHPLTIVQNEIEDIFISMGFQVAESFDIEDEFHNFDALNTPADHPARNLADTFYIEDDVLLRTQTSTVQIRVMEKHAPPIKIIAPGRCYRNDKFDASHSPSFNQVEALVVDTDITFADLKDCLNEFVKKLFGEKVVSRFRPHFFPFTEPSAEMDISCVNCGGAGCAVCKNSGWLEMGGAGMVDPNVLTKLGIDAEKYTGYAFGLGIDRIAMLKYKIPDIRHLFDNDLRFLKQFK